MGVFKNYATIAEGDTGKVYAIKSLIEHADNRVNMGLQSVLNRFEECRPHSMSVWIKPRESTKGGVLTIARDLNDTVDTVPASSTTLTRKYGDSKTSFMEFGKGCGTKIKYTSEKHKTWLKCSELATSLANFESSVLLGFPLNGPDGTTAVHSEADVLITFTFIFRGAILE